MKFSIVNGHRQAAQPNLSGVCPSCEQPMTAKCGEVKAWHWAHRGKRDCDPWWENETEWHRKWKEQFPVDWQEVIHYAFDREKHIADVKTNQGWVIEFQHSRIDPEERRSRDGFYEKLVWVVNGARLQRDLKQFSLAWGKGALIGNNSGLRKIDLDRCTILKEWSGSSSPVFFDFGIPNLLWWLHSKNTDGTVIVAAFSSVEFINLHRGNSKMAKNFDELIQPIGKQAESTETRDQAVAPKQPQQTMHRLVPRHKSRRL